MSNRLFVTIPAALNKAFEKKAKELHITPQDAARMAIVEWVATPLPAIPAVVQPAHPQAQHTTDLTMLKEAA